MFAVIVANLSAFQQIIAPKTPPKPKEEPVKVPGSDELDPEKKKTTHKEVVPPAPTPIESNPVLADPVLVDPDLDKNPKETTDVINSGEDDDDNNPFIDVKAIDEAVLETMLPNLKALDDSIDVSSIKSVDDFIPVYKQKIIDQVQNDPEFKNKVKAELIEELGLDDHIVEQVTNVKKGIDIKKHKELTHLGQIVEMDFDTPDEVQKFFQIYYGVKKTDKADAERLLSIDMQSTPEELEALVNERKDFLKNHVSSEMKLLESNRNAAVVKMEQLKAEYSKKVDSFLSSRVIGGQKRTQEEIDLFIEMTKPGTTEVVLPTGEKKMMSRYQAYVFQKENNVDSYFPELFQNVLDAANGIADVRQKVKQNSIARGAFAKNLAKKLEQKGYRGGVVIKKETKAADYSNKSNEKAFAEIIGKN